MSEFETEMTKEGFSASHFLQLFLFGIYVNTPRLSVSQIHLEMIKYGESIVSCRIENVMRAWCMC